MKRYLGWALPGSLFGRTVLIAVLPILLVQTVSTYIFVDRHREELSRRLAIGLANEIRLLSQMITMNQEDDKDVAAASTTLGIKVLMLGNTWPPNDGVVAGGYPGLQEELAQRLPYNFLIEEQAEAVRVYVQLMQADGSANVVQFSASHKRLRSFTFLLYLIWTLGLSILLVSIAVLFLRNQIRPIRRLARAAAQFGRQSLVEEVKPLRPSGAREVRLATESFNTMQQRIQASVREKTMMLAGISHDLRTPLARMKLELAMAPKDVSQPLQQDILDMERLIDGYLMFVRAGEREAVQVLQPHTLLESALAELPPEAFARVQVMPLADASSGTITVEPLAMQRAWFNIISNACKFAEHVTVSVGVKQEGAVLLVEDNGPGIPEHERERVLEPFYSLDPSRQQGTGLGLAIAKEIVGRHGGGLTIGESQLGGVLIKVQLPV